MERVNDYYSVGRSVTDPARTSEIKIKRSIFTCTLCYVDTMAGAKAFITRVARENKTATHNCWAYVVGDRGEMSHASDAGEPSGTAGKPMLNTLQAHNMTCVAAVVTRQYGGVKLGVRGLIDAYSLSVLSAIEQAPLVRLVKTVGFRVELPYGFNDVFLSRIKSFRANIIHTDYKEAVCHDLAVEADDVHRVGDLLQEYQCRGELTFVRQDGEDA